MEDMANAIKHLREHQTYPASKADLVKTCNELSDFSEKDKRWFEEHLPEGNYDSADEAIQALGMSGGMGQAAGAM